jgi:hypothetical protein
MPSLHRAYESCFSGCFKPISSPPMHFLESPRSFLPTYQSAVAFLDLFSPASATTPGSRHQIGSSLGSCTFRLACTLLVRSPLLDSPPDFRAHIRCPGSGLPRGWRCGSGFVSDISGMRASTAMCIAEYHLIQLHGSKWNRRRPACRAGVPDDGRTVLVKTHLI